ncbi:MAG: type II toxin-antitoxin system VapC family toxin [Streptomycetaceae bacterium]|nr:type II toxin-antitoxin system VapC family toxin [Streptomycetaceae bacterium]
MIVPDVNLLLYSVITAFPQHENAHAWWEEALNSTMEIGLSSPAVFGFVRIATNPRVFTPPLTVEETTTYISTWLQQPNVRFLTPGPRHLEIAFDLLKGVGTGSNLTTDAQLAALAIEHNAEMYSTDTDFARFSGVRWINPLA